MEEKIRESFGRPVSFDGEGLIRVLHSNRVSLRYIRRFKTLAAFVQHDFHPESRRLNSLHEILHHLDRMGLVLEVGQGNNFEDILSIIESL